MREQILLKYKSVYAFCKAHPELPKSSVYAAVAGKYTGNMIRIKNLVSQALEGSFQEERQVNFPDISADTLWQILQASRCRHCRILDKRRCFECRHSTHIFADELAEYLKGGKDVQS